MDIARLGVEVQSGSVRRASQDLSAFNRHSRDAGASTETLGRKSSAITGAVKGMAVQVAAAAGGMALLTKSLGAADQYTNMQNRLLALGASHESAAAQIRQLGDIALATRAPLESTVELYSRLSLTSESLGASQQDLMQFTETVGLALAASGTTAAQASGALTQLSQAMAGGVVRAEEFNSMIEGAPGLLMAVANGIEGVNGDLGALRQMMLDGELTSEQFFNALLSQNEALQESFGNTAPTIASAFTAINNEFTLFIGSADQATGVTSAIAEVMLLLAENMDVAVPVFGAVAVGVAAITAPVLAAGVAIGALAVAVITHWDEIKEAFNNGVDYVVGLGSRLVQALKDAGTDAVNAAKKLGADIIAGIRVGIEQKWTDLKSYVSGLGTGMLDGMKDALGIRSPSREFMEVGRYSVEGLELGWRDNDYLITDAIGSTVDWMIDGFKGGFDGLKSILLNSLKEMARIAIGNPIKVALTAAMTGGAGAAAAGVPGGGGVLSNVLGLAGGGGGALGGIGSGLMGVFSGGGLGSSFANLGGLLSGSVSGWGAVGAALPAAGLLVGVPLLIGALMKKTEVLVAEGVRARIEGASLELDSYEKTKTDNGLGISSGFSRDFDRLDDAVQSAVGARLDATIDALGAFGLGTDLTGFSFSKRTEIKDGETFEGESEEVIREALSAAIEYATGGALDAFQRSGEDMAGTLERLVTSLNSVNPILATLGDNILPLSLDGAAAASALADLAGGLEAFGSKAAFVFGNFLTDQERLNIATQQLNATFGAMSVALPETHAQFRALMDAQDLSTEAGRQLYTALLDVAPLFVEVKGAAQDAAGALAEVAAQNSAVTSAMSDLRAAIAAEVSPLQDQLRVAQDAMRESESVANALRNALRNMRTESQRSRVRASAQATLRDMLTGNRVTDTEAFRDALSVVQEPSENLFGSFVEYQRDFYRTANLISSLETKADRQLSADQRAAMGIETQISQLNALIGQYDTQISATMSVANAVRSLEDALTAQQEAATAASPASREDAYLAANPDVAAAVAAGMFSSGAEHFALHGQFEDRPAFANGGMHSGGMRLVGERGPELEVTGPSRIYSARQTKDMMHDDVLRKEVREMKEYIRELVKTNLKQERALKQIEIQGETV